MLSISMLLSTGLLIYLLYNSCLLFFLCDDILLASSFYFLCAKWVMELYSGNNMLNECQNMLSSLDLSNPAHLEQEEVVA